MNDRILVPALCLLLAGLAGCAAPIPLSDSNGRIDALKAVNL